MRIAAIDFGLARIGLALSDERKLFASPLITIACGKTLEATAKLVWTELSKKGPLEAIVIGLPLLLSGKESPLSTQAREFAKHLEALSSLPIIFWDERLTTLQAERTLKEANFNRKKRSQLIDTAAAAVILQNYLDHVQAKN